MLADRRWQGREIVEAIGISDCSVVLILNDHLGMEKLFARGELSLLINDRIHNRVKTSKEYLAWALKFFRRFLTVDETKLHHNTQDFKQWVSLENSAVKKANSGLSAYKVEETAFWV